MMSDGFGKRKAFSIDDVVLAALYMAGYHGMPKKFKREWLHDAIFRTRQKFPDVFEDVLFDTNGTMPWSEEVDRAVSRYMVSGMWVSDSAGCLRLMVEPKNIATLIAMIDADATMAIVEELLSRRGTC